MTTRVYHPTTLEGFDVTPQRASDLVLNHGWTQTKPIVVPVAAAPAPVVEDEPADFETKSEAHDAAPAWRGTTGRRGRKTNGSEESAEA